jgi:tetratricopeptide (TPR) repeat protein
VPLLAGTDERSPEGYSESFYPRFHYGWSELRAVRTERYHFIEAPRPELYDLVADRGETTNLADRELAVVDRLRSALERIEEEIGTPAAAEAPFEQDEETLRKLAALGYVGSLANTEGKSWRDLPDPKDRVHVYNLMSEAREESVHGNVDEAIAKVRKILAEDPEVVDAWFLLGNSYFKKRDWKEAADLYRKTLEKKADHDYAMIGLADCLVAMGRVEDALLGYRAFLAQDPRNAQITYRLAQVLLDAEKDDDAEREFRRTLSIEPATARAEVGLAVLAARRGDGAAAKAAIARALAIDPVAPHARYNLALILEEAGDFPGAVREYRAEIAEHPGAYKAHFNLGRLLARTGDPRGGAASLASAVAERPDFGLGHLFLAQALLESNDLDGAIASAKKGLALDVPPPLAPLGHYVLADAYARLGKTADAEREARLGREMQERFPRSR